MTMDWAQLTRDVVTTGLAAFGGALSAFLFQRRRERAREQDQQYRALRMAHFATMSQYLELLSLGETHLEPIEDREEAWWQLKPLLQGFTTIRLDVATLDFTFEGSDPDLLNRLLIGQHRYDTVCNVVTARNEAYTEMQRRLSTIGAQGINAQPGSEEFKDLIGRELYGLLRDLTTSLFERHQDALQLLRPNIDDVASVVIERFPKRRMPAFELVPKSQRD